MNSQRLISPPARVEPWRNDAPPPKLPADKVALHSTTMRVDITIDSGCTADDQLVRPAPTIPSRAALEDAVWMVPDGDGWAEVYGDDDGWPVWDAAMWTPAVSYRDGWVVPNGDGWSPIGRATADRSTVSL